MLRFILAAAYDIYVAVTGNDILLPDSSFYSVRGRYIDLLLQGYNRQSLSWELIPGDKNSHEIFISVLQEARGSFPPMVNEPTAYIYVIGMIYFLLGFFTIWIRVFNICLSMLSVYLLFKVSKRYFGDLAANLFLLIALFLPTQLGYSITLSRDFIRVFVVSLTIWIVYNMGGICLKKLRSLLSW